MDFGDQLRLVEGTLRELLKSSIMEESRLYTKRQICDVVGISNEKLNRFLGVGKHKAPGSLQLDDMIRVVRAFESFKILVPDGKLSDDQKILMDNVSNAMKVSSSSTEIDSLYSITERLFRTSSPDIVKMTDYLVGTFQCFRRVPNSDQVFVSPMSVRSLKKFYLPIWKNSYPFAGAQENIHGLVTECDGIFYFVGRSTNRRIFNMMSIVRPPHRDVPYFNGILNTTTRNTPTLARVCIVRTDEDFKALVPEGRQMSEKKALALGLPDLEFISNFNDSERALAPVELD